MPSFRAAKLPLPKGSTSFSTSADSNCRHTNRRYLAELNCSPLYSSLAVSTFGAYGRFLLNICIFTASMLRLVSLTRQ